MIVVLIVGVLVSCILFGCVMTKLQESHRNRIKERK